jgi:hypothetical protein
VSNGNEPFSEMVGSPQRSPFRTGNHRECWIDSSTLSDRLNSASTAADNFSDLTSVQTDD